MALSTQKGKSRRLVFSEEFKTLYCIMTQVYIHLHHPSLILLCSMKLILESFHGTASFVDLILDPLILWKHVQQAVVVNIKDSCVAACCRFPRHPCKCHRPWVVSWLQFCGASLARGEQAPWRSPGQPDQPGQGRSSVKPSVSWQLAVLQAREELLEVPWISEAGQSDIQGGKNISEEEKKTKISMLLERQFLEWLTGILVLWPKTWQGLHHKYC